MSVRRTENRNVAIYRCDTCGIEEQYNFMNGVDPPENWFFVKRFGGKLNHLCSPKCLTVWAEGQGA